MVFAPLFWQQIYFNYPSLFDPASPASYSYSYAIKYLWLSTASINLTLISLKWHPNNENTSPSEHGTAAVEYFFYFVQRPDFHRQFRFFCSKISFIAWLELKVKEWWFSFQVVRRNSKHLDIQSTSLRFDWTSRPL